MHDHRRFRRWRLCRPAKIRLEGAFADMGCIIHDINFNGARISLAGKLTVDRFLKMKIILSPDYSLDVETWVVWHKLTEGRNIYGLYFSRIQDTDKEKIYKFVYLYSPQQISKQWREGLNNQEKGGETMEDRRIFARFVVKLTARVLNLVNSAEVSAEANDVSAKGVGLVANQKLEPNTPVELWLQIPDRGEPLYSRGQVVWSEPIGPNAYRCGVNLEKADLMGLSRAMRAQ